MRNKLLVLMLCATAMTASAQRIIKPKVKTPTSFAIVIDQKSYDKVSAAVEAYKESIEADGLATYLLIDDWKNPEAIKEQLKKLYTDKKSPLEGCVFVGDIPIPMVRDAQHLTSAFKMNQSRDWKESSVASDRYYDDFDLTFDFLKQDADIPLYFYYSLRPDSRHTLTPDIYSGRIKPLEIAGTDKYVLLEKYLKKVVREKKENSGNTLDHLSMGRGHGYNSQDRVAWAGEQIALREQMSHLFRPGYTVKFFDFDTMYPMKRIYLNEVQDEALDVMLFHHHGAPDTQYINGYLAANGVLQNIESVKVFLRSKIPARAKKIGKEAAIKEFAERYDVPVSWCEGAFDAKLQEKDSLDSEMMDIHTYDIHPLHPNARFLLFDACYNGSFYEKDYLAGSYIFADGKTIATIGGTVNALQDKWPDEFVGLLAAGMRIGQFNRYTGYLESHLIGDPTFRFKNNTAIDFDINKAIVLHRGDVSFWRSKLNHSLPDVQGMALRQLQYADYKDMPKLLEDTYFNSDFFVVRMEAMRLLALHYPDQSIKVLKAALNDSYELVRRLSSELIERNGSPEFIQDLVSAVLLRGHEERLRFRFEQGLGSFDTDKMLQEMDRQLTGKYLYNDTIVKNFRRNITRDRTRMEEDIKELNDPATKDRAAITTIGVYRNHPKPQMAEILLKIAADEKRATEVRRFAAHTLGWYNISYIRADIVKGLQSISTSEPTLKAEIERSIHRLSEK